MTASDPALDVRPERPARDGATAAGAAGSDVDGAARPAGDDPADDSESGRRRRRRVSKWDHPPPKDWRWWVSGLGKTLIATGLLMFAFVAYQLWGTAIETARAQRALEDDFATLLAETPPAPDPVITAPAPREPADEPPDDPVVDEEPADAGAPEVDEADAQTAAGPEVLSAAEQNLPPIEDGDPIARLEIPRIGVDHIVVAGVSKRDLQKGPGHYPDTPLPGQLGNSAIAGHRTTYGQPFYDIDQLEPGDELIVTSLTGRYVYVVTGQQIVAPSDYEVVATVDPTVANLTLTSCHPRFTAQQRIVVASELDVERSGPVGEAVIGYGRTADAVDEVAAPADPATTTAGTGVAPAEADERAERASAADPQDATAAGNADGDEADGDEADATVAAAGADADVVRRGDEPEATVTAAGADAEDDAAAADGERTAAAATDSAGSDAGTATAAATTDLELADAFADGWFSDPGAPLQVALWGTVVALIGLGAYLLSRATRRDWVGALVGIAPFVVALYFFFQNVNRLLPPNL